MTIVVVVVVNKSLDSIEQIRAVFLRLDVNTFVFYRFPKSFYPDIVFSTAAGVPCSPFRSATLHSTANRACRFPLQMIFNCSIFNGNQCSNLDGSGQAPVLLLFERYSPPSHLFNSLIKEMRPDGAEKELPHRAIAETPIHFLITDDVKKEFYTTG